MDRLSDLPDAILSRILSLVSHKQAARTSLLSTRWRHLFASVSTFYFFHPNQGDPGPFIDFVDRILVLHGPEHIEKFTLDCVRGEFVDVSKVYGWLTCALERGVRQLSLSVSNVPPLDKLLPSLIYRSKTLVNLKLDGVCMTVPDEVCFPSLKTLHLNGSFYFTKSDSVERLVSACPVLDELVTTFHCQYNYHSGISIRISTPSLKRLTIVSGEIYDRISQLVVDAPSLVYLQLAEVDANPFLLENLHSLVTVDFRIRGYNFGICDFKIDNAQDMATKLIRGISNVQSLKLSSDSLRIFSLFDEPLLEFHNLLRLEITNDLYGYYEGGLDQLLEMTPKLETLIFRSGIGASRYTWHPPEKVASCLISHLKVIEIDSIDDGSHMEMIEYFLKNASVLESLILQYIVNSKEREEVGDIAKKVKELLALPRESKICNVEFHPLDEMDYLCGKIRTRISY